MPPPGLLLAAKTAAPARVADRRLGPPDLRAKVTTTTFTRTPDHLTAHGLILEVLAGPLPGIYDPSGPGRMLFGFFAAAAESERESIREATREGWTSPP
ncbi:hypothetical protein [Streptomyces sp. NBC_00829]|uniref:hypothetical protein n=1 Tax=Streptomyces sp. NBC_00829 TaxID=2903679 RepID=UPI00386F85FA|nr:recombinase family protein [Streptomyces sp. NBC_00829]